MITSVAIETQAKYILDGYIAAAFWTEEDEVQNATLSAEAWATAKTDVAKFLNFVDRLNIDLSPYALDQVGHDLWLTRNHHGCGFWDGDYPDQLGEHLTNIADAMGEVWLYVGDDGLAYFM